LSLIINVSIAVFIGLVLFGSAYSLISSVSELKKQTAQNAANINYIANFLTDAAKKTTAE